MPKFKVKSFPPVRVDDLLYEQTVKCVNEVDEVLSVYIRKAVKMRNKQLEGKEASFAPNKAELRQTIEPEIKRDKKVTVIERPTIPEPKEKVKQMEVKTFMKGGK